MFRPDSLPIFWESSLIYAAYVSPDLLEFSQVIKLLLLLQFLKSSLSSDIPVVYIRTTVNQ